MSSPQQVIAKEGKTVQLVCNVTGVPAPTVTWYRKSNPNRKHINMEGMNWNELPVSAFAPRGRGHTTWTISLLIPVSSFLNVHVYSFYKSKSRIKRKLVYDSRISLIKLISLIVIWWPFSQFYNKNRARSLILCI